MYMIIQTALVAKEIFLKELGSVIPRLQDEKTLPVLTSFAMDSTTLYSWVWLLSSGNCLYLSFTFHDWKIGLLSGYPEKLEVINDSQIFEQGGVVLELCSSWELPIEDGDWFSLMGGTYVVKMSEMIVVSMVDKFRFVHDCGNWVISGCRVAVILCNWELSRENTGMRQLYVWRDFFVEGKFHKKVKQWVMSIPENANELSKNCWSYFDYPVEQSEIEEYVESSDDDYSVKCSVYEFFGGKKLVRISKLTVPRAETAVELDVYGVFGILRGNSVADQDDFIRETDFCGH